MFLDEVSEQVYLETHLLLTLFRYGFVDSFKIDSKNVHAIQISTGNQTLQVGPVGESKSTQNLRLPMTSQDIALQLSLCR